MIVNLIYPKINHSYTINRAITIILWGLFFFITWMYFTDSGFEIYRDELNFYYDEDGFHWIILLLSFPFLFSFLQRILYFVIYGKDKSKWEIKR